MATSDQVYGFYATDAKRIGKVIRAVEGAGGAAGARNSANPGSQVINAKLTSRDDTDDSLYAWSEARRNDSDWELVPDGLAGTVGSFPNVPAVDMRDDDDRDDLTDIYVALVRGVMAVTGDDDSVTYQPCFYIATYQPSTPQEEYTVDQGTGNNQAAWAMFRGHPPLS